MKTQNELIADKVYDLIKYAIYSEDFYGDISEKIEGGINEATAPLHNEVIRLLVQLRQAQEALEAVRKEEREACLAIVETMLDEVSEYSDGSFSSEEHTNRAIHSHLRTVYGKINTR